MTRQFDEQKRIIVPSTIVEFGVNKVIQLKTINFWEYNAIKVAYDEKRNPQYLTKSKMSHFFFMLLLCVSPASFFFVHLQSLKTRWLRFSGEFRFSQSDGMYLRESFAIGQILDVRLFFIDQLITIKGISVGKGFIGNQQKHNFSRGLMTHGSKNHRRPGSLSASSTPSRVYPGKKMAGCSCTTVRMYSKVLMVDKKNNLLLLSGSLPGSNRTVIKVEPNNL